MLTFSTISVWEIMDTHTANIVFPSKAQHVKSWYCHMMFLWYDSTILCFWLTTGLKIKSCRSKWTGIKAVINRTHNSNVPAYILLNWSFVYLRAKENKNILYIKKQFQLCNKNTFIYKTALWEIKCRQTYMLPQKADMITWTETSLHT